MARVEKYGVEWTPVVVGGKIHVGWTEWMIERGMFMWGKEKGTMGAKFPRQYLGEAEHFRRMMSVVLGGGANPFEWNPNATRIVDEYFKNKFLAIAGHGSSSKCLAPHTKVLMYDCSVKQAKDVVVGDLLMGDDSTPRTVLSRGNGRSNMVRIIPKRGDPWECNDDHILTLKRTWASKKSKGRIGDIIDISVKDYLAKSQTFKSQHSLFNVGVEFPSRPVAIDPQIYGIWLGDGGTNKPSITISDKEVEVNEFVRGYFSSLGYTIKDGIYRDRCPSPSFSMFEPSSCPRMKKRAQNLGEDYKGRSIRSPFLDLIRRSSGCDKANQKGGKRILHEYLFNSREVRLKLLAGIIDADGTVGGLVGRDSGTYFVINSSYPGLCSDIVFLARSLGFKVVTKNRFVTCSGKQFQTTSISISGDVHLIPTLRKKCGEKKTRKQSGFTGFTIEQLGDGDWCGFTLDGNHRFLLEDFTVTHNTESIAVISIGEFLASPIDTGILVTSTTLAESRGRVWGRIEYYWQDACDFFGGEKNAPGELVSSSGIIRYRVGNRKDDTKGIKLVPGRESEVKEGIGRMKGFKARRMRLMGDEFSDLSHKLLEAAESNLFLNEDFKMAVAFNPNSHFDPAGVISEPERGWGGIDVLNSDGWKTKRGYCIRFDGEKSPNVVLNEKRWKGLLTADKLEDRRKELGDNSPRFIEQYRGAWSETGNADAIYTEAEIIKYLGMQKVEVWQDQPKLCAGFDPSHTHGGDRAVLVVAKAGVGLSLEKFSPMIEFLETVYLDENIDTTKDKNELIIERLKSEMQSRSIDPRFLAMDATGGGNPLATLMARDPFFSNHFLKVQFGGSASELVSQGVKGKDRYANMASELWYAGKPMLRSGQVRGLRPEMVREMTLRLYEETGGNTPKIRIESKEDMKKRLGGRSPDVSDSMFLCLFAARARLGLASAEKTAKPEKKPEGPLDHLFKWGLRKKPEFEKPDYVLKGGGWGDEGIDLDAVVMGRR